MQTEILLPFLTYLNFLYFSCLIALAGTSSIILKGSDESGYPYIFQILEKMFLDFSSLSIILVVSLSCMALYYVKYVPLIPHFLELLSWNKGFSGHPRVKEPACQCKRYKRLRFDPRVRNPTKSLGLNYSLIMAKGLDLCLGPFQSLSDRCATLLWVPKCTGLLADYGF